MAIYDRSNIDYSGMIRDMINAKTAGAKIAADNIRKQGELWGNFAKDIGGVASRTWDSTHLDDTDMPGIANYVAFGDSNLLDRQLAEAAARRQMVEQQAFQAKEADYNRKLQEKIAAMNKSAADVDKKLADERSYNNARTRYDYALRALKSIPEENRDERDIAKRDLALAEHELNYYSKKLNIDKPKTTETPENNQEEQKPANREESKSVPVKLTDSKAIKRFKTRADRKAQADKLAEMDPDGQKPEIQEEIIRINGLDTDEDKAERKKKYDSYASQYKTNDGRIRPGSLQKLLDNDPEFKKLHKEFGGD